MREHVIRITNHADGFRVEEFSGPSLIRPVAAGQRDIGHTRMIASSTARLCGADRVDEDLTPRP